MKNKYKITYQNGFVQYKNLIPQEVYEKEVFNREQIINSEDLDSEGRDILKQEIKRIIGGEFFTTESPLGKAIKTGVLNLPPQQGGKRKIKIEKL